jgi:hypothetical protein
MFCKKYKNMLFYYLYIYDQVLKKTDYICIFFYIKKIIKKIVVFILFCMYILDLIISLLKSWEFGLYFKK